MSISKLNDAHSIYDNLVAGSRLGLSMYHKEQEKATISFLGTEIDWFILYFIQIFKIHGSF